MRNPYVLVVDDELDLARMIGDICNSADCEWSMAHSVDAAALAIEERVPDVIVTDIVMPDSDGIELLNRVTT